jgi:hypothetical protein
MGTEKHEGKSFSKKDLRQVQGHQPQGCGSRDLRELKTQAASGVM